MAELEYEVKAKSGPVLKYDPKRAMGTAIFSRFHVVDKDGDYTKPNFLPNGAVVPLLIAHTWSDVPVGKGKIRVEPDGAYVDFTLTDSARAKELAEWLRYDMGSHDGPVSEWSYGFSPYTDATSREMVEGKSVRVLHARPDGSPGCVVHEASYCLRGAGIGTALVSMKAMEQYRFKQMHEKILAQIAEREREEQAEIRQIFERFQARERELGRC